jgi:SAM-dependent methyltransferase
MKQLLLRIPLLNRLIGYLYLKLKALVKPFKSSGDYWESRYQTGGNSGHGSYNDLCLFKADVLNNFVAQQNIKTVIDFGCGDGNQLKFSRYPSYLGFDVSQIVIEKCRTVFKEDHTKNFKPMSEYSNETADLCLSLDVIYHLVEDDVFEKYMNFLFKSATQYIIIYSSNTDKQQTIQAPHVKHRLFSEWIATHQPRWQLTERIDNKYPYSVKHQTGSFADFYIYKNVAN